jgi:hypothetical protein
MTLTELVAHAATSRDSEPRSILGSSVMRVWLA